LPHPTDEQRAEEGARVLAEPPFGEIRDDHLLAVHRCPKIKSF
jgi:hypothetical protein